MIVEDMKVAADGSAEVTDRYHRKIEYPPAGEHLWTLLGVFRVQLSDVDRAGRVRLDVRDPLTIDGPGCFVCEQPWSKEVADAPCPGNPSEAGD